VQCTGSSTTTLVSTAGLLPGNVDEMTELLIGKATDFVTAREVFNFLTLVDYGIPKNWEKL
jgi:hypothetical protein